LNFFLRVIHPCRNKSDLEDERVIQFNEREELAESYGIQYSKTSAEAGKEINKMFELRSNQLQESELLPTNQPTSKIINQKNQILGIVEAINLM
jgi:GTPase SAR1 family protein